MRWLFACCLLACDRDNGKPNVQVDLTHEHDSATTIAGVRFTTVFELEASVDSPLLVMLHGRGDTADDFKDAFARFPIKLQLSLPLAPLPFGNGRQWFEWPPGTDEDVLADVMAEAADKVWPAIEGLAHGRKVMIGGFSQGAMVSYALAVKHADAIACVFPIGGRIPHKLVPPKGTPIAPIVALHGSADKTISINYANGSIKELEAAGATAELHEYPGVGHTINRAMYDQLVASVRKCMR